MNSTQRKVHKYVWMVLVIVVPLIIVMSIKDLDITSIRTQKTSETAMQTGKGSVYQNEIFKVNLYEESLDLVLKQPVKSTSIAVYGLDSNLVRDVILGQLSTEGTYRFTLKDRPAGVLLFDGLKNTEISKLLF